MEKHAGAQLNKTIIEKLDVLLEPLFRNGELESRAASHPEIIDVKNRLGEDKKILKEKEPYYRALMALIDALTFEETLDDAVYMIPGLQIPGESKKETMFIPVSKIENVANIIEADFGSTVKFEDLTGIKLPNQIHQYRSDRKGKLDGFDIDAPRPRLVSESQETYENMLKTHYGEKFVAPTITVPLGTEERTIRVPYPHERTDYRNGTAQGEGYQSESYSDYMTRQTTIPERSRRPATGERIRVTESELASEKIPFFTRLKTKATLVGQALENGKFWKGAALVGAAYLGIKYVAIPLIATAYGPMVIGIGGSVAFYEICKAYFRRVKAKRDAKAVTRTETETPETTERTPETRDVPPELGEGPEATPIDPDLIDIDGLKAELLESQRLYQQHSIAIENLSRQLTDSSLSDEEKAAKEAEITELKNQQKQILTHQKEIIDTIYSRLDRGRSL